MSANWQCLVLFHQPAEHGDKDQARHPAEQDFKPHQPAQEHPIGHVLAGRGFDNRDPVAFRLQVHERQDEVERTEQRLQRRIFSGHRGTAVPDLLDWCRPLCSCPQVVRDAVCGEWVWARQSLLCRAITGDSRKFGHFADVLSYPKPQNLANLRQILDDAEQGIQSP
jgi:hypothetical protein